MEFIATLYYNKILGHVASAFVDEENETVIVIVYNKDGILIAIEHVSVDMETL